VSERLAAGSVRINAAWADARTPSGGIRASGWGLERSELALREYQYLKHVVIGSYPATAA
jgi:acyl-CoA reductase-like NAD-dependent aldehyde dehydrogenase